MPNNKKIGMRIKGLRISNNMSQASLAEKIGVSNSSIGMYELGIRIPRDSVKLKLATLFDVSVQSIFYDD